MGKEEFTLPSRDGKTSLHAIRWTPEGAVRGVVQLSHGVAEYVDRYDALASFLTARGFAVVGNDHLGHGGSVSPGSSPLYFGPLGGWDTVTDDLYALRCGEGRRFPGVPYFLLGHSMGSFLVRTYLIRYPGTVSGALLSGTGQQSALRIAAGRLIAVREAGRVGWDHPSPLVTKLAFGAYNKRFSPNRTAFDWLSVDSDNVDGYLADPLCGGSASVGLFRDMLDGLDFIRRRKNLRRMNLLTPVVFLSGSMDPVGDCGAGVQAACDSFRRAGVRDVTMKLYPGARHEILNDVCRETVQRDIAAWLDAHGAAPAADPV